MWFGDKYKTQSVFRRSTNVYFGCNTSVARFIVKSRCFVELEHELNTNATLPRADVRNVLSLISWKYNTQAFRLFWEKSNTVVEEPCLEIS